MLNRRNFVLVLGATFLSGCGVTPPLLDPGTVETLRFRTITMDMSEFSGLSGRSLNLSNTQIGTDIGRALQSKLNPTPEGNSDLSVKMQSFRLVSPGQTILVGGASSVVGTIQITNLETRAITVPPTEVSIQLSSGGGLIDAALSRGPTRDYQQHVDIFTSNIKSRLYGPES